MRPAPGLATRIAGIAPNPANPRARVAFVLEGGGPVRLTVHDLQGHRVKVLLDDVRGAGAWDVAWDGGDDHGRDVASGVYVVRLAADGVADQRRIVIVR